MNDDQPLNHEDADLEPTEGPTEDEATEKDAQPYRHYNPVNVHIAPEETAGAVFMFVIALILLIAFLRAQKEIRTLQAQLKD